AIEVNGDEVGFGFTQTYCDTEVLSVDIAGVSPGITPLTTLAWSITKDNGPFLSGTNTAIPQNIFSGTADAGVYVFTLDGFVDGNGCTLPNIGAYTATITIIESPTVSNAGPDQTVPETCDVPEAILAANTPTVGTGQWSIVSGIGGVLDDDT